MHILLFVDCKARSWCISMRIVTTSKGRGIKRKSMVSEAEILKLELEVLYSIGAPAS